MNIEKLYNARYLRFLRDIKSVSKMTPKEQYLYRVMDGVPFKDLETALMMAKDDYEQGPRNTINDNKKNILLQLDLDTILKNDKYNVWLSDFDVWHIVLNTTFNFWSFNEISKQDEKEILLTNNKTEIASILKGNKNKLYKFQLLVDFIDLTDVLDRKINNINIKK